MKPVTHQHLSLPRLAGGASFSLDALGNDEHHRTRWFRKIVVKRGERICMPAESPLSGPEVRSMAPRLGAKHLFFNLAKAHGRHRGRCSQPGAGCLGRCQSRIQELGRLGMLPPFNQRTGGRQLSGGELARVWLADESWRRSPGAMNRCTVLICTEARRLQNPAALCQQEWRDDRHHDFNPAALVDRTVPDAERPGLRLRRLLTY